MAKNKHYSWRGANFKISSTFWLAPTKREVSLAIPSILQKHRSLKQRKITRNGRHKHYNVNISALKALRKRTKNLKKPYIYNPDRRRIVRPAALHLYLYKKKLVNPLINENTTIKSYNLLEAAWYLGLNNVRGLSLVNKAENKLEIHKIRARVKKSKLTWNRSRQKKLWVPRLEPSNMKTMESRSNRVLKILQHLYKVLCIKDNPSYLYNYYMSRYKNKKSLIREKRDIYRVAFFKLRERIAMAYAHKNLDPATVNRMENYFLDYFQELSHYSYIKRNNLSNLKRRYKHGAYVLIYTQNKINSKSEDLIQLFNKYLSVYYQQDSYIQTAIGAFRYSEYTTGMHRLKLGWRRHRASYFNPWKKYIRGFPRRYVTNDKRTAYMFYAIMHTIEKYKRRWRISNRIFISKNRDSAKRYVYLYKIQGNKKSNKSALTFLTRFIGLTDQKNIRFLAGDLK